MQDVEFRVLGSLEVHAGGMPIEIGSRRQRLILAVLIAHAGAVVSSDRLIDALWGEDPPETALTTLRAYVSRLRRALGGSGGADGIETRPPGYRLQVDREGIDATRFENLLAEGRRLLQSDPAGAERVLAQALELWRGPAYDEFTDREFARAEAVRLEELRLAAREGLIEARLGLGRHVEVVGELEALVAEHPLREGLRIQLTTALYRCGRQAEALEVARSYRARLDEDLGLEPSRALGQLEQGILQQSPRLEWTPPGAGAHLPGRRRGRVPLQTTPLFGRESDIDAVREGLSRRRLVTLTGPGGVGKSRLAWEVGARVETEHREGAWICELAPVKDPQAVGHAILAFLGLQPQQGRTVTESIVDALRTWDAMLVLDNCEHVLEPVAAIAESLLGACPGVLVLATSRERLAVPGEQMWPVRPLPVPDVVDVRGAADSPSVAVFVDRARDARPEFEITEDNVRAIVEICRELDGLPLAIELAASRTAAMSPADLADRLDERFRLLSGGRRGDDGRHRTLRAVVDWSYGLLDEAEKRLFERLSVFAGGFTLEQAEAVCAGGSLEKADIPLLLAALVDRSLLAVGVSGRGGRYEMLETLRRYARERLGSQAEELSRRHAEHFAAYAEEAERGIKGPDESRWVELLNADRGNLRAAFQWAMAEEVHDLALRIPVALFFYARWRMHVEILSWAEGAAEAASGSAFPLLPAAYGVAAVHAAYAGELDRAVGLAERGLALVGGDGRGEAARPDAGESGAGDPTAAYPMEALGEIALYRGRLGDCARYKEMVAQRARASGDLYLLGATLTDLSLAVALSGDVDRALEAAEEIRRTADATSNPTLRAWELYTRGEAIMERDPDDAIRLLDRAAEVAGSVENTFARAVALVSAMSLRGRHGRPREALQWFREVIAYWHRAGDWTHQWTTLRNLVDLLIRLDRQEAAAVLYGALTGGATDRTAFGAEAERLERGAARVHESLGADRFSSATNRGRRMGRDEIVAFAMTHTQDSAPAEAQI